VLKFATAEILSANWSDGSGVELPANARVAHRHEFSYTPKHGMLYVRSRMISSRCNDNFDEFPAEEIAKGYRTFIGKPVFVNHHNDDHRRMRGLIIDAALHEDRNPDGTPDTWVEGLMEVDGLKYPKLAKAIILGHIERTSMGVDVAYSICSVCNRKATTPLEYCAHVPGMKGKTHYRVTGSGRKVGTLIRETCYGLRFFENSLLVEPPADPTAYFLGKPELGPGLDHLAMTSTRRTAARQIDPGPQWTTPEPPRRLPAPSPESRWASLKFVQASQCLACRCKDTIADTRGNAECFGCGHTWHEAHREAALQAEAAKYDKVEDHPWFQAHPVHHDNIVKMWNQATDDEKASGKTWYKDAHNIAKSISKLAPVRPEKLDESADYHRQLAAHETRKSKALSAGKEFSEPEPQEPHDLRHPHGDNHLAAGMLAIYSPQTPWVANMHNAARVLDGHKGIGGKGGGILASESQKNNADKVLKGANYNDVLSGPKIRDFAHLIEHGGDKDPTVPHVVVDRHALSVAAGHRMSDEDYSKAPLAGTKRKDGSLNRRNYDHVVSHYHEAARQISEKEGQPIAGHQVQAVTWLAQQRLNQKSEREKTESKGTNYQLNVGREKSRSNSEQKWEDFRKQKLPEMNYRQPGTGYQASRHTAYGETKAPADVDTLREENCPVCGEDDAWDGNACPVCGFVAPPKMFQDPDLDKAKQIDLRQQQQDYDDSIVPDPNDPGMDVQPDLVCDNCGTEFGGAEPTTVDTDDPQAGSDPMASSDPMTQQEGMEGGGEAAEGDVCPACGKGVLVPAQDAEGAYGEQGAPPEGDEDQDGDGVPDDEEQAPPGKDDPGPVDPRDLADPDDDGDDDSDPDKDTDDDAGDDKKKPVKSNPFAKKK
jgi:hypothetical protein